MNQFIMVELIVVGILLLAFIATAAYCLWHAHKTGNERLLEFCVFGTCDPPPTREELERWGRIF